MGKSTIGRINASAIGVVLGLFVVLLFFQNCGKAGMEGDDFSSLLAETPDEKKFKEAPFPFDVSINQIAYMTCPVAKKSRAMGEDVDSPFFNMRVGAFDNRSLASRFPVAFGATATGQDRTARLKAGVSLSKPFINYIKTQFAPRLANAKPEDEKRLIRDAVMNTKYKFQLSSGFVYQQRNALGFAFTQQDAKAILAPLTTLNMANQLVDTEDLGTFGREKVNTVTGVDLPERSFVSSINIADNPDKATQLRGALLSTEFQVGFTRPELAGDVFMLEAPSGQDNSYAMYGKSYRVLPRNIWPGRVDRMMSGSGIVSMGGIPSIHSEFLSDVQEWETLSRGAPRNVSQAEGHRWSCFALMIVREVDRRDPITGKIFDPGAYEDSISQRNCKLWGPTSAQCLNKLKFYDFQLTATSPIIPAAKVACPIQEIGSATRYGSLNYQADGGLNRMRLEIARRFLPAEYWDINTHPEYMCAVPRTTVQGRGECYASGDFNGGSYIFYSQSGVELGNAVSCGRDAISGQTQKECPAFVSICYRTN